MFFFLQKTGHNSWGYRWPIRETRWWISRSEAVLLGAALMASKEMTNVGTVMDRMWWYKFSYWFICVYVYIRYVYIMCIYFIYYIYRLDGHEHDDIAGLSWYVFVRSCRVFWACDGFERSFEWKGKFLFGSKHLPSMVYFIISLENPWESNRIFEEFVTKRETHYPPWN